MVLFGDSFHSYLELLLIQLSLIFWKNYCWYN